MYVYSRFTANRSCLGFLPAITLVRCAPRPHIRVHARLQNKTKGKRAARLEAVPKYESLPETATYYYCRSRQQRVCVSQKWGDEVSKRKASDAKLL
jgi:hypothetical protein